MNIQRYSISDLEKLTGIKAHTIRVWEKRYGIISPERTDTNIRFYSVSDLHRLLNISFLNRNGFKISLISGMNDQEIDHEVSRISEKPGADEGFVPDLITAVSNLDEDLFERVLNTSILKLGFELAIEEVVFPLLQKVTLMWQLGRINACQERFVNNLIRHKLVVAIDGLLGQSEVSKKNFMLYLPSGHYDEIQLLFANYLLRKLGNHVIYLGPSIPLDHLKSLNGKTTIDYVVVGINPGYPEKDFEKYMQQLTEIFPHSRIAVITPPFDNNGQINSNVSLISSCKGFHEVLESFS